MKRFKEWMLDLTDADWGWWPVVHLRPAKSQRMTTALVAKLTLIYGTLAALLTVMLIWNDGQRDPRFLLPAALVVVVCYFLLYRVTFARWWNERAARLARDEQFRQPPDEHGAEAP